MTLTVETGVGVAGANSYVDAATATAYATANGLPWPADVALQEAALRRATMWIDLTYRSRFPGYRVYGRSQGLEWPRAQAFVENTSGTGPSPMWFGAGVNWGAWYYQSDLFDLIPPNTVPIEIARATIEAASREAQTPGVLLGDVSVQSAQQIKKEAAGGTSFEYFQAGVTASTTSGRMRFPIIDAILAGILIQQSGYTARAARA